MYDIGCLPIRCWSPPCVLAAGSLIRSIPLAAGRALAAGPCGNRLGVAAAPAGADDVLNMPWDAYTKRISSEQYLAQRFRNTRRRGNSTRFLRRRTACFAPAATASIWSAGGRMSSRFGGTACITSTTAVVRQTSARATASATGWSIDDRHDEPMLSGSEDIVAEYWNDARLVTSAGTVALRRGIPQKRSSPIRRAAKIVFRSETSRAVLGSAHQRVLKQKASHESGLCYC